MGVIQVVICDDEIHIRNGLKKVVEQADPDFQVAGLAANGCEAHEQIKKLRPDIVLMDINMPGMNGLEVMAAFADTMPEIRYIVISGHDQYVYVRKAMQLGAYDYLLKPVDRKELISILRGLGSGKKTSEGVSFSQSVRLYIEKHFREPELSLSFLAGKFYVSESYLTRVIKKECGKSYTEYLNMLRLEEAKRLLGSNPLILSQEVAEQVGYLNKNYFCRLFKQYTGVSPTGFQKGQRQ